MANITKLSIFQMAADALDEEVMSEVEEDRKVPNWLNRNYDVTKEALLATGRWNFARERATLPAKGGAPAWGYTYWYELPADILLLYPITYDGGIHSPRIHFTVEGRNILTDKEAPLYIRYIKNADESEFHPLFAKYLSMQLAYDMAHWMTGKVSYVDIAEKKLKRAKRDALLFNGMNTDPEDQAYNEMEGIRF
jgi:hypothetical protein